MAAKEVTVLFEDATIKFLNLEGRKTMYTPAGYRSFSVVVDAEQAMALEADGWNIKRKTGYPEEDDVEFRIDVKAEYDRGRPPKVVAIVGNKRTFLDKETVGSLDWADIETIDVLIRAYDWEVGENSGRKAYLKSMYVTIEQDPLDEKYEVYRGEEGGNE